MLREDLSVVITKKQLLQQRKEVRAAQRASRAWASERTNSLLLAVGDAVMEGMRGYDREGGFGGEVLKCF